MKVQLNPDFKPKKEKLVPEVIDETMSSGSSTNKVKMSLTIKMKRNDETEADNDDGFGKNQELTESKPEKNNQETQNSSRVQELVDAHQELTEPKLETENPEEHHSGRVQELVDAYNTGNVPLISETEHENDDDQVENEVFQIYKKFILLQ